ncbi:hypothetical protein [Aeromonas sp. MR16]|uniref:hypothetical protein n=1 Tax=Aeromonas sp. MR16 TaxID=2923420 RepID=UPI001F4A292D|nr:hypothetical protein [Aeromonas sp. MR16]MCH7370026.1 hypothetical protein [Aeromonas sp. MR16]
MKRLMVVVFLGLMLMGCANGIIAHEKFKTCEGYDEYKKAANELGGARPKLIGLRNSSHRAIPEAITVTEGNVTKTFLVNPLDDEIDELSQRVAELEAEVAAFKKSCSIYQW